MGYENFNWYGSIHGQPLKPLNFRNIPPDVRGYIRVAEWFDTIGTFIPHLNLPVATIGRDTRFTGGRSEVEEGIVLLEGMICSTIGMLDGDTVPGANHYVSGFQGATLNSFYGVAEGIDSWLVPANGGGFGGATYTYSALDEEMETYKNFAGAPAASGDTITFAANKPVGILYEAAWQTKLPGAYLNNQFAHKVGLMVRGYIEMPYFDGDLKAILDAMDFPVNKRRYYSLARKFMFAYTDDALAYASGSKVIPDIYGHYVIKSDSSETNSVDQDQIVGRAVELRKRGPLSMNQAMYGPYQSGATSQMTAGFPAHLFWFVFDCEYLLTGTVPTIAQVSAKITGAETKYGLVRIHIDV